MDCASFTSKIIRACKRKGFARRIGSQQASAVHEVADGLGTSGAAQSVRRLYSNGCVFVPMEKMVDRHRVTLPIGTPLTDVGATELDSNLRSFG